MYGYHRNECTGITEIGIIETIDYLKQVKNIGKSFIFSMTTNAMLLDKYMDFLVEKDFRLMISLDGDEHAHGYRVDHAGENSFRRVFHNAKMLQNKYSDYFNKRVSFNSVLHNKNSVESAYQFIKENFGITPNISPLNSSGIRKEKEDEFKAMYQNSYQSVYRSKNCETIESEMFIKTPRIFNLAQFIHQQSGNVFDSYNDLLINYSGSDFLPTGTCLPFSKKMYITVNGKILPCERVDHNFFFGNVYDNSIELDCKKVADQHNTYISKYLKQCRYCARNRQCPKCVYQDNVIRNKHIKCQEYCNQNEYDNRNNRQWDFLREHPHYYERILNEIIIVQ